MVVIALIDFSDGDLLRGAIEGYTEADRIYEIMFIPDSIMCRSDFFISVFIHHAICLTTISTKKGMFMTMLVILNICAD